MTSFIVHYINYPNVRRVHSAHMEAAETAPQALSLFRSKMSHCRTEAQLATSIRPLYIERVGDEPRIHEVHIDSDNCWDIVQDS